MRWTKRDRPVTRSLQRTSARVEPLERRALLSAVPTHAVPLSPGIAAGPADVLTTLTPTFTWSAAAGVKGYELRVSDRTDNASTVDVKLGPDVTEYTVAPATLLPGRRYVWAVRDIVGFAVEPAHAYLRFTTPVPPAPTALAPGGSASSYEALSTVRPTLTWSAVPNVSGYVIHVYDRNTLNTITHTVGANATSYTFAAGALQPGARFDWNVHDLIDGTAAQALSNSLHFQLPPLPAPVVLLPGIVVSPGPVLTTATATFSWQPITAITGFSGYLIELSDLTKGVKTTYTAPASATSYALPAGQLVPNHKYVWNLRLLDGNVTAVAVSYPFRYFVAPAKG
jgi:hypothetical protein